MRGIKPDKLPTVVLNSNTFMCQYYGATVKDYVNDPKVCAELNLKFIKEFEPDSNIIATGYILYGAGPELGVEWTFAGANFPGNTKSPIKNQADLDNMQVPKAPKGYFKNYLEAISLIVTKLGDSHHLKACFLGPFSLGCFLHGLEQTAMDMIINKAFFRSLMTKCTEISVFLGKEILKTGLRYPILNEIFLAPGMMSPQSYHDEVESYVMEVQRRIGIEAASNSFTFMGLPNNPDSQKRDKALFSAFFGVGESLENIRAGIGYRVSGYPYPAAISGRALNNWDSKRIIEFLKPALEIILAEGEYPSISYSSVQADTKASADAIAEKIKTVNAFRDSYRF
jgi:hypothetical protein